MQNYISSTVDDYAPLSQMHDTVDNSTHSHDAHKTAHQNDGNDTYIIMFTCTYRTFVLHSHTHTAFDAFKLSQPNIHK